MNKGLCATTLFLTLLGCGEETTNSVATPMELDGIDSKVSYVIGYNTANQIEAQGFKLDLDALVIAIQDVQSSKAPRLSDEEMRAAMSAFQAQLEEKRQQAFNQQAQENLVRGQAYLAENAKREEVVTRESGLQYEILLPGDGASPRASDWVTVNYKGMFISGKASTQPGIN